MARFYPTDHVVLMGDVVFQLFWVGEDTTFGASDTVGYSASFGVGLAW
jgi:hypothetical protein